MRLILVTDPGDDDEPGNPHARNTDPITSKISGNRSFKTGKLRVTLLMLTYWRDCGYTAREVEELSLTASSQLLFGSSLPLGTNPWSRFSDAKLAHWIAPTGEVIRGETGQPQLRYQITEKGMAAVGAERRKSL